MNNLLKLCGAALGCTLLTSTLQAEPTTAFVHLFEWQWDDIASECENVLGPKGYAAVQVSPPQESIQGSNWWTRYQPVSYAIEGRSGNREQFQSMVNRCSNAGVDIYVDAVINHMAAWDRNFPEVPFSYGDFNSCTDDINYANRWSVQNCDLVGLNDLATHKNYVQTKIADYLNDLTNMGVAGFRIDAAKHIPAGDINAIKAKLIGDPYIYQEVIGAYGEPVQTSEYTYIGDVTEFNFTKTLGSFFKRRAPLKDLLGLGSWSGWLNSDDAVTFVANHDNQRQDTGNTITHKDGQAINDLAHVFALGWPYGYPKVMSSYDWNDHDQGPPSQGASSCSGGWLCEHRNRSIANMVAFRNFTAAEFRTSNTWTNGNNQIAWGRGGLGFVAMNMDGYNIDQSFDTGMKPAVYCDVLAGDFNAELKTCSGPTITVGQDGKAHFTVYPEQASAIHVGAIVDPIPCENGCCENDCCEGECCEGSCEQTVEVSFSCQAGYTYWGQSVYVVGNQSELGNWNPANAIVLNANSYPTWQAVIELPANTSVEWKCIKRDENNATSGLVWQNGANNRVNTGSANTQTSGSF